jgi:acylphosphatase
VLVVEGRLTLRESVRLDGVVFARQLVVEGDSVELSGAVRVAAGNGSDGSVSILGAGQLRRSRCAVQKALAASVTPRPVAGRKWAELY